MCHRPGQLYEFFSLKSRSASCENPPEIVSRARICKPFKRVKESIPSLAESIFFHRNRFLGSLNVYKYGL